MTHSWRYAFCLINVCILVSILFHYDTYDKVAWDDDFVLRSRIKSVVFSLCFLTFSQLLIQRDGHGYILQIGCYHSVTKQYFRIHLIPCFFSQVCLQQQHSDARANMLTQDWELILNVLFPLPWLQGSTNFRSNICYLHFEVLW